MDEPAFYAGMTIPYADSSLQTRLVRGFRSLIELFVSFGSWFIMLLFLIFYITFAVLYA